MWDTIVEVKKTTNQARGFKLSASGLLNLISTSNLFPYIGLITSTFTSLLECLVEFRVSEYVVTNDMKNIRETNSCQIILTLMREIHQTVTLNGIVILNVEEVEYLEMHPD